MPNTIFRNNVIERITNAVFQASNAFDIDHLGLRGRVREIAIRELFTPFLIEGTAVGSGKIIDSLGKTSRECDVVIYSKSLLPSVMYSEVGFFPIETCACAIEVKSKTSSQEMADAILKARSVNQLVLSEGIFDADKPQTHNVIRPITAFLAFASDLEVNDPNTQTPEFFRMLKLDNNNGYSTPSITSMCIVGQGYWCWQSIAQKWAFSKPSKIYDEVIDFMSGIINSIPNMISSRGHPRICKYIMRPNR